jgi:hypothetical protein
MPPVPAWTISARQRRRWPRRAVPASGILIGVAVFVTACGGGSSSPGVASTGSSTTAAASQSAGSSQSTYQQAVDYAKCMRAHGVPNFPDPNSQGKFVLGGVDPSSSGYQAAQDACKSLAPPQNPQQQAQNLAQALKFAQCMRAHGVPNFPDPSEQGNGGPIMIKPGSGVDPNSPQYQKAMQACRSDLPGGQAPGGDAP